MDLSTYKAISINGIPMKKITIGGVVAWARAAINWVRRSINADGTIYNGTGYKDGYRVRSGGAETSSEDTACTGYIKVAPGDVIRFTGWTMMHNGCQNAINVAGDDFENLGQITSQGSSYGIFTQSAYSEYRWASIVTESAGVWRWVVPPASSGAAYIRVNGYNATAGWTGAEMIVTVNEEIA